MLLMNKKIALIGNPNVGKSTLFNELTGLHQHTGNWSGKTVDVAIGKCKNLEIYDLPGTYSLIPHSKEEEITSEFILAKKYDIVLIVCDANMLERGLNLVLQTLEVTNNAIMCLNMMDEIREKNIVIDTKKLSEIINIPVLEISAKNKLGINEIIEAVNNFESKEAYKVKYDSKIEQCIEMFQNESISRFEKVKNIVDGKEKNINGYLISESINPIDSIMESIYKACDKIATSVVIKNKKNINNKLDKILTNKITGIPIMILFMICILYISIVGANHPSNLLFKFFSTAKIYFSNFLISVHLPNIIISFIMDGVYQVLTWVISVMLPPMAIFFPIFTLLEDYGILPRIAFNLDGYFQKCNACGKQALTMCMGFGCNVVGVTNSRIIDSKKEKLIAIITNSFMPCNGRFPGLIAIISLFFVYKNKMINSISNVFILALLIIFSILITFIVSKILSKTIVKKEESFFTLELPPYRKPKILKVIVKSLYSRTLVVLIRTIFISIPAGMIIWLLSNLCVNNHNLIYYITNFINPFGVLLGLDGVILISFILGFPANEIVIPLMIMGYLSNNKIMDINNLMEIKNILILNHWTIKTAICMLIFIIFHFPCSTTLLTIKKETSSFKWTIISFFLPLVIGTILCLTTNMIFTLISNI